MFTESWLQALTRSASLPAARLIKPLLNDIDCLCQTRGRDEHLSAADRTWEYAKLNFLLPLLQIVPTSQPDWEFANEDTFAFAKAGEFVIEDFESWKQATGLEPYDYALQATVTSTEWASLLRSEAVRQKRAMSVPSAQDAHTLRMCCAAKWENGQWSLRFANADWVRRIYDEPFETSRPLLSDIQEVLESMAIEAESMLLPLKQPTANLNRDAQWSDSVAKLQPLHQSLLLDQGSKSKPWFRKVWAAVWPVIYREQNVLTKPCDINFVRDELAECFRECPSLTVWMFAYAKLICVAQLGRGLGVCGNFRRG